MSTNTGRVRTRFAPSPTGTLHVGNVRSALFAWLWARHSQGDFILRIEDTDQTRYDERALAVIFETLAWLGLDFDEGPDAPDAPPNDYFQTQRRERYQEVANHLIDAGHAYYCYCSAERLERLREQQKAQNRPTGYDRRCRDLSAEERADLEAACEAAGRQPVVRLAVPLTGQTTVTDAIRGEMTVDNRKLEDVVILKSDGLPTYHLAHLVDDHDMGITHAMRGEEYIPTFPLHILMYRALEWEPPVYVHLPLILNPSGKGKISKRDQENMTMMHEFREAGYLPEAMVNYLVLLGWSVGPDRDLASVEEMIEKFDIQDIKKSPSAFNYEKLDYMNGYYIRQLPVAELAERVAPFLEVAGLPADRDRLVELLPLVQERMKRLAEAPGLLDFFLADPPLPDVAQLPGKKMDNAGTIRALEGAREAIERTDWTMDALEETLRGRANEMGLKPGQLFKPIRVAITGRTQAPGIFETIYHVGRERVVERLARAIRLLQEA